MTMSFGNSFSHFFKLKITESLSWDISFSEFLQAKLTFQSRSTGCFSFKVLGSIAEGKSPDVAAGVLRDAVDAMDIDEIGDWKKY